MDELSARIRELLAAFTRDVSKTVRDGALAIAAGVVGRTSAPMTNRGAEGRAALRLDSGQQAPKSRARTGAVKGRVLAAIGSRPGLRSEELRSLLGLERAVFAPSVRALIADGVVRSVGVKRGTRYYPTSPMSTKARVRRSRRTTRRSA